MKPTIKTLSKKWKRPIRKIIEVVRIYEGEEILEDVIQNTTKETFTLKDAASYAKGIFDQYGRNVDSVDFREKEIMPLEKCEEGIILLVQCKALDEDDSEDDFISERQMLLEKRRELDELELDEDDFEDVLVSATPALYEGNEYKSYLYNVDEEEDLFNIDKNVLYLMKKGRLIDIENKKIENKICKIVTVKDVKGKARKLVYTWNEKKKEYRARSYPEEDVQKILGKYPDDEEYLYGFSLEKWINRGCLGLL